MISHKKKFIFFHVPKAGGSSIFDMKLKQYQGHRPVTDFSKEEREKCFTFSIVRNPYNRLLSAHSYLTGGFGSIDDLFKNEKGLLYNS